MIPNVTAKDVAACPAFRRWILVFAGLELGKVAIKGCMYIVLTRRSFPLQAVPIGLRLLAFVLDSFWAIWFAYGNILYYSSDTDAGIRFGELLRVETAFSVLFCVIVIYGYMYMTKYVVDFVMFCCVMPLWYIVRRDQAGEPRPDLLNVRFMPGRNCRNWCRRCLGDDRGSWAG